MKPRWRSVYGVLILAAGLLLWSTLGVGLLKLAYQHDYLSFYTGADLVLHGRASELSNLDSQRTLQDALVPGLVEHYPWVRPPFYALFLAPLALMPVGTAFYAWIALQLAGLAVVFAWSWRRFGPDSMTYCAFFLPAALGVAHGQDGILLALLLLGAWSLLERDRDFAAGLLIALALFKFHLLLLVPLALLLRRRWRVLGGYVTGGIALAALSLAVVGVRGLQDYVAMLTRSDMKATSPELMVGFNSIGLNLYIEPVWARWILMAIPLALVIWNSLKVHDQMRWFWTAVVGSLVFSPHSYGYDMASLLVPALLAAHSADRTLRIAAAAALAPIGYFFLMGGRPWAIVPSLIVAAFLVVLSGAVPTRIKSVLTPTDRGLCESRIAW